MTRVYIDSFDGDRHWSTDSGTIADEQTWKEVRIRCAARTVTNMQYRGSKIYPCAWIECEGTLRPLGPDVAEVV